MVFGLGGGKSSNNQNQSSDTNFNGTSNTVNTPNAPGGYTNAWQSLLGMNGNTPGQTTASNYFSGLLSGTNNGAGTRLFGDNTGGVNGILENNLIPYQAPQVGQQDPLKSSLVGSQTGASAMAPYSALYGSGVIDPVLGGYDQQAAQNMNARHAAADAGSAFGDRAAVGDAVYQGQSDVGRAALASQLGTTGFTNAAQLGQTDAARALQAATTNAGNQLQVGEFNNTLSNAINTGNADRSLSAATNISLPATQMLANNVATQAGLSNNAASSLAGLGGMNFSQIISALAAGTPLFGSTSNTDTSGQSQAVGSGNSSGKGTSFGFGK